MTVLRNVHTTPTGWDQHAENLARLQTYDIVVSQTDDAVTVSFPRGTNNILTTAGTLRTAEPTVTVVDRGDWWVKEVVAARWTGAWLSMHAVLADEKGELEYTLRFSRDRR